MKHHLDDGQLRAAIDDELPDTDRRHLSACSSCQERLVKVQKQAELASHHLSFLGDSVQGQEPAYAPRSALQLFHQRLAFRKEKTMLKKIFSSTALKWGLAAALIIAIVISVPATRALAGQLLGLFRVQQVVVLPVDFTGMQQLTGNSALGQEFSQLVSSAIVSEQNPGKPVSAADNTQASQLAGFTVRLPQGQSPSNIYVENASAFSFKVDRAKAQALLDEAGRSDLVLPASIDGAEVSINIPAGVSAAYGTCPDPTTQDNGLGLNPNGSAGRRYVDCVIFAQIPSPTVSAPDDVNIAQLAQIGLEFTGMSSDQAAAFTQSVNWATTLVVPIPRNAATYQQVTVDGVSGTLIQRPADDAPQYLLLWVKDGIIYAISSLGSNSQQAITMANSLP